MEDLQVGSISLGELDTNFNMIRSRPKDILQHEDLGKFIKFLYYFILLTIVVNTPSN